MVFFSLFLFFFFWVCPNLSPSFLYSVMDLKKVFRDRREWILLIHGGIGNGRCKVSVGVMGFGGKSGGTERESAGVMEVLG